MQPGTTEQDIIEIGQRSKSLPSPEDYRQVNAEHLFGAAPELSALPASYHIDYSDVPDLFQSKIGACTNHAYAEILIKRQQRLNGKKVKISPRFGYTMCKIEDGIADKTEQGTYCNMPFKIGVKYGFSTDDVVPNDTSLSFDDYIFNRDIRNMPKGAFESAAENRIPGYAQVGRSNNITESQLKQGLMNSVDGLSICMPVGSEWWTAKDGRVSWMTADIIPIRKVVTQVSGHDITMTGWEIEASSGRTKIYFRNHWSLNWADKDNGWFYLDQHTIAEAWMVTEIPDALLAIIKSLPSQKDFTHTWNADMHLGSRGDDVTALQIALKIVGTFPFNQPVTTYYGAITAQAVSDFQRKYKVASEMVIVKSAGGFGPLTRETLNKIFSR